MLGGLSRATAGGHPGLLGCAQMLRRLLFRKASATVAPTQNELLRTSVLSLGTEEKLPGFGCTCLSGSKCTPVASLLLRRRSVIVGAGYIAVEIAGILSTLGSKSSLLIRRDKVPLLASPTVPPVVAASQAATDLWWGSQESSGQEAERRRAAEPIPAATVRAESFCSSACQGTCFPEPRAESWPEERKIIMILKKKKK